MRYGQKTKNEGLKAARDLGIAEEYGLDGIDSMIEIVRLAKSHHTLQEHACMGDLSPRQKNRERNIEDKIKLLAGRLRLAVRFDGDPRGYTVKLFNSNGAYNTFGGLEHGYAVGDK